MKNIIWKLYSFNQLSTFAFIFILFTSHKALSSKIMLCKVKKEIENGKLANKRLFEDKPLIMYFEPENNWFFEIKNKDWFLNTNEDLQKTKTSFKQKLNFFYFNLKIFQSPLKKKIELNNVISFEKESGHLKFSKEYYNYDGDIFFTSVIEGHCK